MQPRLKGKFATHSMSARDRVESRLNKTGDCWIWTGSNKPGDYGRISVNGKVTTAHRVIYEAYKGLVPDGLEIDHLCENKSCANPDHLEAVTHQENTRRGKIKVRRTHCKRGHELTEENTSHYRNQFGTPVRQCKDCRSIVQKIAYQRLKLKKDKL